MNEINLPRPIPLFEEEPDTTDYKELGFTDEDNYKIASILYRLWCSYGKLVQDERLWEIINNPHEKDSDVFLLQNSIVQVVNDLEHALGDVLYHLNRLR